jgi:hypothetical protein
MWRFLNNDSVTPGALVEPLQQMVREECAHSGSAFVLVVHDWCKLDFKSHTSKKDVAQITHKHDIGYELMVSLAVEADQGIPLALIAANLRTSKQVHSTMKSAPKAKVGHLGQIAPVMDEVEQMGLGRTPVHVIDREGDSLGHFRQWSQKKHLFLVRCDDRRVKWNGQSVLLSEINEQLDREVSFKRAGKAKFHGVSVRREVAEVEVVLDNHHKTRIDGKQKDIHGEALHLRAVFVRLVDNKGYIVAEWMLLTNVPSSDADAATIGLWYYYRWKIESFFKLLKGAGHELEYWQQKTGKAILLRLLIASMACVYVWQLRRDKSEAAAELRDHLMKLSGRLTKHGVESTDSGLLAGWQVMLAMLSLLENGATLPQLRRLAKAYGPPGI